MGVSVTAPAAEQHIMCGLMLTELGVYFFIGRHDAHGPVSGFDSACMHGKEKTHDTHHARNMLSNDLMGVN